MRRAILTGSFTHPQVVLHYTYSAPLTDKIRMLPGRFFDPDARTWVAEGFGPRVDPVAWLRRNDFVLERDPDSQAAQYDLDQLVTPIAILEDGKVLVRHRFSGFDHVASLMPGAEWDKERRLFVTTPEEFVEHDGGLMGGFMISRQVSDAIEAAARTVHELPEDVIALLHDGGRDESLVAPVAKRVGDVPDWFAMTPFDYQRSGAIAMAAGAGFNADDMGLGKTVQGLAAAAMVGSRRLLVICPNMALSVWGEHAERTGFTAHLGQDAVTRVIVGGRKEWIPDGDGVLVVGMTMLARRKGLKERIDAWGPDAVILDESHLIGNYSSMQSKASRWVARRVRARGGRSFALTGTPLSTSPAQVASQLDFVGALQSSFGSYAGFMRRYCTRDPFGRWQARKETQPELGQRLRRLWIRRLKDDVYVDAGGRPILDHPIIVPFQFNVPGTEYEEAHAKVVDYIDEFLYDLDHLPTSDEIDAFASDNLVISTFLWEAAGLAKAPVVAEQVAAFVEANRPGPEGTWDRPLLVWVHFRSVAQALLDELTRLGVPDVAVYNGLTPSDERDRIVEAVQAGRVAVLVAGIKAANSSITLTRISDQVFAEVEWTTPPLQQAIGRSYRIGQTKPVFIHMARAAGTSDDVQFKRLTERGAMVEALTPGQDDLAAGQEMDEQVSRKELVTSLVNAEVARAFTKDGRLRKQVVDKVERIRAEREAAAQEAAEGQQAIASR